MRYGRADSAAAGARIRRQLALRAGVRLADGSYVATSVAPRRRTAATGDDEPLRRTITGHVAIFDVPDADGDTFLPGCFRQSLRRQSDLVLLDSHDPDRPIGLVTAIAEDELGLAFAAELFDHGNATDCFDRAARRELGCSMSVLPREYERLAAGGRRITRADVYEVSLGEAPKQPRAVVASAITTRDSRENRALLVRIDRTLARLWAQRSAQEPSVESLELWLSHSATSPASMPWTLSAPPVQRFDSDFYR